MQIDTMRIEDYLGNTFPCACGRSHTTALKTVVIKQGALRGVPAMLRSLGKSRPFLIADQTTLEIAGHAVVQSLTQANIPHTLCVIPEAEPIPDEAVLGRLMMAFPRASDVIIGIGSGTINDLSRFVSYQTGLPYYIVGTAPSMDGFASTVAPLITNHMKITYEAQTPEAIVMDLDILARAPAHMIAAGFGDILGKFTCLCDWQIASLINNEYHCPTLDGMMRLALKRTLDCRKGLAQRDPEAIRQLAEALVLAGIGMSFARNSRPASGCEHHLAHYWEMRFLFQGKKAVLHGTKVGIAEIAVLGMYEMLAKAEPDFAAIRALPTPLMDAAWEAEIRRVYGPAADEVIALEKKVGKNAHEGRMARLVAMEAKWPEIRTAMQTLPSPAEAIAVLEEVHGLTKPAQVGLDAQTVYDSILYAKEMRNRHTLLQLLWDMRLLEKYANHASALETV